METVQSLTRESATTTITPVLFATETPTTSVEYKESFELKLRHVLPLKQKYNNSDCTLYL